MATNATGKDMQVEANMDSTKSLKVNKEIEAESGYFSAILI